ncbi:glycosyltransferase family 4 protein [Candidatus Bathyarchaeota archaeon]|nr:glycosyltransferase family 4 protein [Candidatus Bathyarchaeota archaeon]
MELLLEPSIGGGPISAINLTKALTDRGHSVTLVLGADTDRRIAEWVNDELDSNVVYTLGYRGVTSLRAALDDASDMIEGLSSNVDVVNAHGISGLAVPEEITDRLVVTNHGHVSSRGGHIFSSTIFNRSMWSTGSLSEAARIMVGGVLQGGYEKRACRRAQMVLTPSHFEKGQIIGGYGIDEEKVHRVPNLISLPEIAGTSPSPDSKKTLLYVGGLSTAKGTPLLVKAARYILGRDPEAGLTVAGDGPLRGMVQRLTRDFPERVRYQGVVHGDALSSLYSNAWAFLFPSLYESFGLSIAEALSMGLPVIAYDATAIPEMVIDGENGVLAKPYDVDDIAEKALALLTDPDERTRMSGNARRIVETLTDSDRTIASLEKHYREVA